MKNIKDKSYKELKEELNENLKRLNELKNYDCKVLLHSLVHLTSQLLYFYDVVAKGGSPERINYKRTSQSLEHCLIYVNLGRGFPKELMDGHWCYVVKDMNCKLLIIPTTSIKEDSVFNEYFDMDILSVNNYKNERISRLSISDIRTIDVQRIDYRRKIRKVTTDRSIILNFINEHLFND